MDVQLKDRMKRLADGAQKGLARSLLCWKYRKAGIPLPHEDDLEAQSQRIVEKAQGVIVARGKNIIHEFKKVYSQQAPGGKGDEDR